MLPIFRIRNSDMNNLHSPQNSTEKPNHLKNIDGNYENFYSHLRKFNTQTWYNDATHNVKKCVKAVKRKNAKVSHRF